MTWRQGILVFHQLATILGCSSLRECRQPLRARRHARRAPCVQLGAIRWRVIRSFGSEPDAPSPALSPVPLAWRALAAVRRDAPSVARFVRGGISSTSICG